MADSLILEVADLEVVVLTGIYSEETGKPLPLRISIAVRLKAADRGDFGDARHDPRSPRQRRHNPNSGVRVVGERRSRRGRRGG